MKLLFDANISRRIIPLVSDLFPASSHVLLEGFEGDTPDEIIGRYPGATNFTIVTADIDFLHLVNRLGLSPKVVGIERMEFGTVLAADLVRSNSIRIFDLNTNARPFITLRQNSRLIPG